MEEQQVREAIRTLIERKERRIRQLRAERENVNKDEKPVRYRTLTEDMSRVDHGICTLIELEHVLRLCGCPDEAYADAQVEGAPMHNPHPDWREGVR